jgi:hypothetical protein
MQHYIPKKGAEGIRRLLKLSGSNITVGDLKDIIKT